MITVLRKAIRNTASAKKVKPRLFDAVVVNGEIFLEVKQGSSYERVSLFEVEKQLKEVRDYVGTP